MNNWMASEGLDIQLDPTPTEGFVTDHGGIIGKLLSISQEGEFHKVIYSTKDVDGCFKHLVTKPESLTIKVAEREYSIKLVEYNYKIDTSGNNLIVTIEERYEK